MLAAEGHAGNWVGLAIIKWAVMALCPDEAALKVSNGAAIPEAAKHIR